MVAVSVAAVSGALLTGCGSKGGDDRTEKARASVTASATASEATSAPASPSPGTDPSASASPTTDPSASKSAKPSATPTSAKPSATVAGGTKPTAGTGTPKVGTPVVAAPVPTAKPGPVAPPPPPAPAVPHTPPLQSSCKPSYPRPNEPKDAVSSALVSAAGQARTLKLSNGGTDNLPALPVNLVKAIAWQESGWQSGILACDGGIGTMQVMPNTVSWMNGKYGTNSDPNTLAGNVQLGTQLLDWLVAYYGDSCFGGTYDLGPDASGKTPLLDLVIAAYNAGAGKVHYTTVTDPATGVTTGSLEIPNPSYVANVKALMSSQPWTKA